MSKIYPPKISKKLWRVKNQSGFIPMLIMIVLILAIFIWLVYSRVSNSR